MNEAKPDDLAAKAEKLAAEAVEAGKKFIATDTGKKVADATETAFQTASEMGQKLADSDIGKKALDSEIGRQAVDLARQASEQAKANIPNVLGRNVAVGAAAGAIVALPIPFVGPVLGAVIGAGLGYLRTVTKKN
jgi:cytosine/adenosine deaminase-related metal-dependent hydrolase